MKIDYSYARYSAPRDSGRCKLALLHVRIVIGQFCTAVINAKGARIGYLDSYSRAMVVECRHIGDASASWTTCIGFDARFVHQVAELCRFGLLAYEMPVADSRM